MTNILLFALVVVLFMVGHMLEQKLDKLIKVLETEVDEWAP